MQGVGTRAGKNHDGGESHVKETDSGKGNRSLMESLGSVCRDLFV